MLLVAVLIAVILVAVGVPVGRPVDVLRPGGVHSPRVTGRSGTGREARGP